MASTGVDGDALWRDNADLIRSLYQGQDGHSKTLPEVKAILETQHGFPQMPLSTYETKLKELGMRKKLHREDWFIVWSHCYAIKERGVTPEVSLNERPLPPLPLCITVRESNSVPHVPPTTHPVSAAVRLQATAQAAERETPIGRTILHHSPSPPQFSPDQSLLVIRSPARGKSPSRAGCNNHIDLSTTDVWKQWKNLCFRNLPCLDFISKAQAFISSNASSSPYHQEWPWSTTSADKVIPRPTASIESATFEPEPVLALLTSHDSDLPRNALALEFDLFFFLVKAVYRFSNQLVKLEKPSWEDTTLYTIVFTRVTASMLKSILGLECVSTREAWINFMAMVTIREDRKAFATLIAATPGHISRTSWTYRKPVSLAARTLNLFDIYTQLLNTLADTDIEFMCDELASILEKGQAHSLGALLHRAAHVPGALDMMFKTLLSTRQSTRLKREQLLNAVFKIFLQLGVDVDQIHCERENGLGDYRLDILFHSNRFDSLHVRNKLPRHWRATLLEEEFRQGSTWFGAMRCLSKRSSPGNMRIRVCEEASKGPENLRTLMQASQSFCVVPEPYLELMLAEQFLRDDELIDWGVTIGLLEYGVDVTLPSLDMTGDYMLHCAVRRLGRHPYERGGIECLELLLKLGLKLDATAVECAACFDGVTMLKELQRLGADIGSLGTRALCLAVRLHNESTALWLLEAGVDINSTTTIFGDHDRTVIGQIAEPWYKCPGWSHYARRKKPCSDYYEYTVWAMLQLLLKHGALLRLSPIDLDPLQFVIYIACRLDGDPDINLDRLKWLVSESGVDLNHANVLPLLQDFVELRRWDHVKYLVECGAPVCSASDALIRANAPPEFFDDQFYPWVDCPKAHASKLLNEMRCAAQKWQVDRMKLLLNAYEALIPNPPPLSSAALSLVTKACIHGTISSVESASQVSMIELLIDRGEKVDGTPCPYDAGITPLELAIMHGDITLVMLLLDKGANPNIHGDSTGIVCPLCTAKAYSRWDIAHLLINAGAMDYSNYFMRLCLFCSRY
ncbi:serine/threonine-protein phosphatase 6 regulatory ankyrin repeat subunit B [Microdochium nivale]|nr:serine/threonine-protein phosphatase 6 regulatory ankyrin repeat subunit B [Microdochium nivale]